MKHKILISLLLCYAYLLKAQEKISKPTITLESYKTWEEVDNPGLSNNGKFAFYRINNRPLKGSTYVITNIDTTWKLEFTGLSNPIFSMDSRLLIGKLPNDTLLTINLNNRNIIKTMGVKSFEIFIKEKTEWIAINLISNNSVLFRPLNKLKSTTFKNVTGYTLSTNGKSLIIKQTEDSNEVVKWADLNSGKVNSIFNGKGAHDFIFNKDNSGVAFTVTQDDEKSIWYYKNGLALATRIVDNSSKGIQKDLSINTGKFWEFSIDNENLIFTLVRNKKVEDENENLKIWNYQDAYLRSYLDGGLDGIPADLSISYLAVVNLKSKVIRQITSGVDNVISKSQNLQGDNLFLIASSYGRPEEADWNEYARVNYYLCSLKDTSYKPIKLNSKGISCLHISPSAKFVVYYEPEIGQYFSYQVDTKKTYCITNKIKYTLYMATSITHANPKKYQAGYSGWLTGDKAILINDAYDIWQVDPTNTNPPVNITHEFGRKNNIVLKLSNTSRNSQITEEASFLTGVNLLTKDLGFYKLKIGKEIETLFSGPYYIGSIESPYATIGFPDLKQSNGKSFLLKLAQADSAPNFYFTTDFKTFLPISTIQPQKKYNWLTSELLTYRDIKGNSLQGVLYKPENFDSKKKYPVILNYYMTRSFELNSFRSPEVNGGDIDIPYLVSNGYLVFLPDIESKVGEPGEGALNSILAAADHLCKFIWIDCSKMAVTGHSLGGYETNYIITHSNRFACAVSAAGFSDLVSHYSGIWGDGKSEQAYVVDGPPKMKYRLTENVDGYIKNSPILYANFITTPLLMMHNPLDGAVSFNQSIEFFTILRSLKKKVWMLSYKGENHVLFNEQNKIDYYSKLHEFLDYYLKDGPKPEWMIKHISPYGSTK